MIEVTEAVKLARQFAADLFEGEDVKNLGLEEVIFDDDSSEWRITLGYDSHITQETDHVFSNKIISRASRVYKRIHIGADEGDFKDMFVREVGQL